MAITNTPEAEVAIDEPLIRGLLRAQHPDLADEPLCIVAHGWDNVLARLGDALVVRLPRRAIAAALVLHEQRWLPELAPRLPLPIPVPLRAGVPGDGFPWPTIVDRLKAANVPVLEYYNDLPTLFLWGSRMTSSARKYENFKADAAAGKLPNVTFVSPTFTGANRTDDHPTATRTRRRSSCRTRSPRSRNTSWPAAGSTTSATTRETTRCGPRTARTMTVSSR